MRSDFREIIVSMPPTGSRPSRHGLLETEDFVPGLSLHSLSLDRGGTGLGAGPRATDSRGFSELRVLSHHSQRQLR